MDSIEHLISEYEHELSFEFTKNMPDKLYGLIDNKHVYINNNISQREQLVALAEEIGHYETSIDADISDYSSKFNRGQENRARLWSYLKLISPDKLKEIVSNNNEINLFELSEKFGVTESLMKKAIDAYRVKGFL